jgi:hypothetical protein
LLAQTPDAFCLARGEISQILPDLVADTAKEREPFLLGTLQSRGIFKVVMDGDGLSVENRAALFGVVADGQDVIELVGR